MRVTLRKRKVVTVTFHLITFLLLWDQFAKTTGSHIKLQEGFYNDIVIGIDGRIAPADCRDIINNITSVFHNFSIMLHSATKEKVAIGQVKILIPFGWDWRANCKLDTILEVDASYSYQSSDLQISQDHPLAKTLPWTRQYKPCGKGGDSIIVPKSFLLQNDDLSNGFTSVQQAQILLHEWTKFKYGVFDEFGYIGKNEPFASCYLTRDNQVQLTSCSSSRLPPVTPDISMCTQDILRRQKERMTSYFSTSQTSIMSLPHIEDVSHYCNQSTHNVWAPSKQNAYCSMKSVQEVVDNHADIRLQSSIVEWKPPEIQVIQRKQNVYATAYAFVIDTSDKMKAEYKLSHVKQALAQFLDVLEQGTDFFTVFRVSGFNITSKRWKLQNDDNKSEVLNFIESVENSIHTRTETLQGPDAVVDEILKKLKENEMVRWNVVFLTASQFIQDVPSALSKFEKTSHYVSILSFDDSSEWLEWYGIPNTKIVVVLPYCFIAVTSQPCDLLTSAFILDHLFGLLNEQEEKPTVIQKIGQIQLPNQITDIEFTLTDNDSFNVNRFFIFLPVGGTSLSDYILLPPYPASECTPVKLLEYDHVYKFQGDACTLQSGVWTLKIKQGNRTKLHLNVFVEYKTDPSTSSRLIVTPAFGSADSSKGISSNSSVVPVFVSVKSENDEPVLGATVSVRIYNESSLSSGGAYTTISLRDDGNYNDGIDQTTNDGVYSAYLKGYSSTPAYHLAQIFVSTDSNSTILKSIEPSNAVLLDDRMANKCCGKFIEPNKTMPITPPFKFQMLHFGFKTLEPSQQLRYPPGTIGVIRNAGDSETTMSVEFISVIGDSSGDKVDIDSIQACCVISSSNSQSAPQEQDCKAQTVHCVNFEAATVLQTCSLSKQILVDIFIPEDSGPVNWLNCRLQVINEYGEHGQLSESIFPVNVSFLAGSRAEEISSCTNFSIKNKCLPIWIFWVLIGCVALLLILLVLFICLWYRKSGTSKQSKTSSPHPVKSPEQTSVYYNKEDNYNTPPQLSPKPPKHEPNVVKELFINHAYIQEGDGEIKIITDKGQILKKPIDNKNDTLQQSRQSPRLVSPPRENDNMQVYKPATFPQPPPKPRPTKPSRITKPREQQRPQILHSNPMLRSDSSFDINHNTSTFGHPQSQFSTLPIDSRPDPAIVYASIGRNGRLRPIVNQRKETPATLPSKRVTIDPHYMVPNASRPGVPTRHREPLPNPEPPHIHSFPSTDSEDEFRNQQQYPVRHLKPPPYPGGSQLLNRTRPMPNGKPAAMQMGQSTPSPIPPPVAPPRYDRSNSGGAVQQFTTRQEMSDDDEDSDNWDDGMEFDYNVGISYA